DLFDAPGNAVPVQRAHRMQRFQHHQRQRSLPDVRFVSHTALLWFGHRNIPQFLWLCNRNILRSGDDSDRMFPLVGVLAKGWCKTLGLTPGLPRVAEEKMWRIS